MKVTLLVSRSGPAGAFNAGDEIEVSADEGGRMIEAGQAARARIEREFDQQIVVRAYLGCLQHTLDIELRKSVLATA